LGEREDVELKRAQRQLADAERGLVRLKIIGGGITFALTVVALMEQILRGGS
jgi:hypothetical protein